MHEIYYNKLTELKKQQQKDYKCNLKLRLYSDDYELVKYQFKGIESDISPMLACDFGEVSIYFADPEIITDKYDKSSIINEMGEIKLGETYNLNLLETFLKKIKEKK